MKKISDKKWFANEKERLEKDPEYLADGIILAFTEELLKYMEAEGMNKKDLAKKLNCSQAYITKLFRGNPNLTIKKMVELALVFNSKISIQFQKTVSSKPAVNIIENSSLPKAVIKLDKYGSEQNKRNRNISPVFGT